MRFWRRNVRTTPADTTPTDRRRRLEPDAASPGPPPPPEPEAAAPVEPQTWSTGSLARAGTGSADRAPPPCPKPERGGWFGRLRAGLSRSSTRLNEGINTIFARRRLDAEALDELEELLIASDMGTGVAGEVVERLRGTRFNQEIAPEEVREALAEEVIKLIEWVKKPLRVDPTKKPFVILVIGVNGSGKTTTIGKLAQAIPRRRQERDPRRRRHVPRRRGRAVADLGRARRLPGA